MKKLILISVLFLTITGCQTIYDSNTESRFSNYDEICGGDTTCPSLSGPVKAYKAEAMNINTGQTYWTRNHYTSAKTQMEADRQV